MTEGVDEFVELIINAENVVAINMSLRSESARGITHSFYPKRYDDPL